MFLDDKYLEDVEGAEVTTQQLLDVYRHQGVVPLVESSVKDGAALKRVHSLLGI